MASGRHDNIGPGRGAPPEGERIQHGDPGLARDSRLLTHKGCLRLDELTGTASVVFWSGRRWVTGRVAPLSSAAPLYRVTLDDGRAVVCSATHPWLVLKLPAAGQEGRADTRTAGADLVPTSVAVLRPGDRTAPILHPRGLIGKNCPHAYEFGQTLARRVSGGTQLDDGLPRQVFEMDLDSLKQFFAGWLDEQGGVSPLRGCDSATRDLQILYQLLDPARTVRQRREGGGSELYLPGSAEQLLAASSRGAQRKFHLIGQSDPRVATVEALGVSQRTYSVHSDEAGTGVVNGVLVLVNSGPG